MHYQHKYQGGAAIYKDNQGSILGGIYDISLLKEPL